VRHEPVADDASAMNYRFGRFELLPREWHLLMMGDPVAIVPRPFDVLLALVGPSGELVTKEKLLELGWPDHRPRCQVLGAISPTASRRRNESHSITAEVAQDERICRALGTLDQGSCPAIIRAAGGAVFGACKRRLTLAR